jgi:hypothetical protein
MSKRIPGSRWTGMSSGSCWVLSEPHINLLIWTAAFQCVEGWLFRCVASLERMMMFTREDGQNQGGSAETACRENGAGIGRRSAKNGLCRPGHVIGAIKNPAKPQGWGHNYFFAMDLTIFLDAAVFSLRGVVMGWVSSRKSLELGSYALIHENFRVPGFLSIPASSDRLGAARRQGQYAVKGSGARGVCYPR